MAAASGGKCGAGALAGGVGSLATPLVSQAFPNPTTDASDLIGGTVATAVAGGIASVAGGGKFGNGAVTAAFAYLFNEMAHCNRDPMGCPGPIGPPLNWGVAPIGLGIGAYIGSQWDSLKDWLSGTSWSESSTDPGIKPAPGADVHGNSAESMRSTEVYHLINNATGDIDKIGITSNPSGRYSQSFLANEGVSYVPQAQYQSRYPAMVHENIELNFYYSTHGRLPRLNQTFR